MNPAKAPPTPSLRRRLARGGALALAGKLAFILGTLAWNALLTRLLPPPEVGTFYLIASIALFGELIVLGGLNQAGMRLVASRNATGQSPRPAILGGALLLTLFAVAGGTLYATIIGPYIGHRGFQSPAIVTLSTLTAVWFALRAIQGYLAFLLRGFHRLGLAALLDGASTSLLFTGFLLWVGLSPAQAEIRELLLGMIGAVACTVVAALLVLRPSWSRSPHQPGLMLREPLRIGLPLAMLALASIGIGEVHVWIAGILLTPTELALYGAATRLAKLLQMPLQITNGVIGSSIAELSARGERKRMQAVLQTAAAASTLPTLLGAIVFGVFAQTVLGLVFGDDYTAGWPVLGLLAIGYLVSALLGSAGVLMTMSDRQNHLVLMALVSGALGVAISLWLAPQIGIAGIALGVTSGRIAQNLWMWHYCRRVIGIDTHASLGALRHALRSR